MATFYGSQWAGTTSGSSSKRYFRGYVTYTTSEDANYYYISISALGMQKTGGAECVMVNGTVKNGSLTVSGASIYSGNPISLSTTAKWSWSDSNTNNYKSLGGGTIIIRKTTAWQNVSCYLNVAKSNGDTSTSWGGRSTGTFTLSVAPYTRSVSFNANGGSGLPNTITQQYGTSYTIPSTRPTKSGYDFLGWSTSSTATVPTYTVGQTVTMGESVTLYAVWHLSYVAPTISNLRAVRVNDRTSIEASAAGTIGLIIFDYTAPQQASDVIVAARFSTDTGNVVIPDPDTSGEKYVWSIGEIGLNDQATIAVTVTGKTYTGQSFIAVTDSTYISTQTVVWDAYQDGIKASFGIGTIAEDDVSKIPDNGRLDIKMDTYLKGDLIGDLIVKTGFSNDYYYVHRASGLAELWLKGSVSVSSYTTVGSFYGYYRVLDLPSGVFNQAPITQMGTLAIGTGFSIYCGDLNSRSATSTRFYGLGTAGGTQTISYQLYLTGRWK